jgi:phospholipid/cholesterol/gamma-HCH transport system permease protein
MVARFLPAGYVLPMDSRSQPPAAGPSGGRRRADFHIRPDRDGVLLALAGRLDAAAAADLWKPATAACRGHGGPGSALLDLADVDYLDAAGAALVHEMRFTLESGGRDVVIQGAGQGVAATLELVDEAGRAGDQPLPEPPVPFLAQVGRASLRVWAEVRDLVGFTGDACASLAWAVRHPGRVRWGEAVRMAETAGVDALAVISLTGFVMGLVLAFQSAIPLKRVGADIYVADMIGLSVIRELGPLVTAILLAGRSGSAFAAEIGTMKVGEELSALKVMDLDPVRFLVLPRVLAAMAVTPVLCAFFTLTCVVGGAVVYTVFGYPLTTYFSRIQDAVGVADVLGGLFKVVVFGLIVAGVGCAKGLSTGAGARAVGRSTTRAVVASLVLIAAADGMLAMVYYVVGI